jgi:hypothetical protein
MSPAPGSGAPADGALAGRFTGSGVRVICRRDAQRRRTQPARWALRGDAAYVIYTSGSPGRRRAWWFIAPCAHCGTDCAARSDDTVAQIANPAFDVDVRVLGRATERRADRADREDDGNRPRARRGDRGRGVTALFDDRAVQHRRRGRAGLALPLRVRRRAVDLAASPPSFAPVPGTSSTSGPTKRRPSPRGTGARVAPCGGHPIDAARELPRCVLCGFRARAPGEPADLISRPALAQISQRVRALAARFVERPIAHLPRRRLYRA